MICLSAISGSGHKCRLSVPRRFGRTLPMGAFSIAGYTRGLLWPIVHSFPLFYPPVGDCCPVKGLSLSLQGSGGMGCLFGGMSCRDLVISRRVWFSLGWGTPFTSFIASVDCSLPALSSRIYSRFIPLGGVRGYLVFVWWCHHSH